MKISPKEKILQERGLVLTKPRGKYWYKPRPVVDDTKPKTALMKYLEQKYKVDIVDVLLTNSLSKAAKRLGGEVDTSTLSKWIKRLRLRYTKDNLPECKGCKHRGVACDGGICYVLISLELWDLVPIKKEELLGEGN